MDKKLGILINNYISKILKVDKENKTLDEKLNSITQLTDSLIDYCIKNKIIFFIENKIGYSNIVFNFKYHLATFIKNLIDPSGNIINKYIKNDSMDKDWDNVSDINSLLFKNFKNMNETFQKNVTFNDINNVNNVNNYDDLNNPNEPNNLNENFNLITNSEKISNINNLSLYIKLLFNQQKYVIEFTDKITTMCNILANSDIKYKKINPYN